MATALIPTPLAHFPVAEVLAPGSISAQECDRELRQAARSYRQSLVRIAYYGAQMRNTQGWLALGYADEDAYRESLDIPRSTFFKYVRIGEAFSYLSIGELQSFQITNLQLLLAVNPGIVHDYRWLEEAKALKPKQLAELVAQRNRTVGDERVPLSAYVVKVPFLAKRAIEQMVEQFRRKHELSSPGQALEFMIADHQGHDGVLTELHQVRRLLHGVEKSLQLKANRCPLTQERQWLKMAMEIVDESYQKALSSARAKSEGSQED